MKLTKYGISVALISFIGYLLGYFSIVPVAILFIFVLYSDLEIEAKQNVTQATLLALFFLLIQSVLTAVSGAYVSLIDMFSDNMTYRIYNILSNLDLALWLSRLIALLQFGILIYSSIVSLKGTVVKIPLISGMVAKHFGQKKEA